MSKRVKRKIKYKYYRFTIYVIALIIVFVGAFFLLDFNNNNSDNDKSYPTDNIKVEDIIQAYSEKIVTLKSSGIYIKDNDKFLVAGNISANTSLFLESITPSINDKYFKIKDADFYVIYSDIKPVEEILVNNHYENYLIFNKNIVTNDTVSLYLAGNKTITINKSLEFPIVMIDDEEYYVEFNGRLMSIKKSDVAKEIDAINTDVVESTNLAVLNYHFFNDPVKETCNEAICLEKDRFETHLKYLADNSFYTVTMNDFNLWMDKKIRLPKKSVLITVDDGALGTDTHLIELLEKYNMNATLFLITAWWNKDKYKSSNLEIHSHGYNLHRNGKCGKTSIGQCLTKDELIEDLNKSIDSLDKPIAFCYPFYAYNNTMIDALKDTGFKLAFVGGNRKAKQSDNKYLVPRYVIYRWHLASDIAGFVN